MSDKIRKQLLKNLDKKRDLIKTLNDISEKHPTLNVKNKHDKGILI